MKRRGIARRRVLSGLTAGVVLATAAPSEAAPKPAIGLIVDYDINSPVHGAAGVDATGLLRSISNNRRVMIGVRGDVSLAEAPGRLKDAAKFHPIALGAFNNKGVEGGQSATPAQARNYAYYTSVMRDETLGSLPTRSFNAAAQTVYFAFGLHNESAILALEELPGVGTVVAPDVIVGYGAQTAADADSDCRYVKQTARAGDTVQVDGQSPVAAQLLDCIENSFAITGLGSMYATNYQAYRAGPNRLVA